MNKDWHSDHFCCWQCDSTLTGQRYILRDEHPYCITCYESTFGEFYIHELTCIISIITANVCDECGKAIGIDSKVIVYLLTNNKLCTFTGLVIQRKALVSFSNYWFT